MRKILILAGALIAAVVIANFRSATAGTCSDACEQTYAACTKSCPSSNTDCFTKCLNDRGSCLAKCQ